MEDSLFRKESLDQLNAPKNLDAYLKVTNIPGWIILAVVILVLAGCAVWALTTSIDGKTVFELLFN